MDPFHRASWHPGAEALEHAHQRGIVHRDVKPSNLLLDADDHLYVTDFGLAQVQSETGITLSGDVLGTLRYMSPEQAAGATGPLDHRADIYSLGTTLYELLTLRPVFASEDRVQLLRDIAEREPPRPRELYKKLPENLERIIQKALAKAPQGRYTTAQEMSDDLRRFTENEAIATTQRAGAGQCVAKPKRRWRAVRLGAAALMLAATVLWAINVHYLSGEGTAMLSMPKRVQEGIAAAAIMLAAADAAPAKKPPKDPPPPPPVLYQITWLGESFPRDVNDSGEVVGSYNIDGFYTAFVSTAETSGLWTDLNTIAIVPEGFHAWTAHGINEHGQVVGKALDTNENSTAFLYDPNATPNFTLLPSPFTGYETEAHEVNDSGDIVGIGTNASAETVTIVWKAPYDSESVVNLGSFVTSGWGPPTDINNTGVIVNSGGIRLTPNEYGAYTEEFFRGYVPMVSMYLETSWGALRLW